MIIRWNYLSVACHGIIYAEAAQCNCGVFLLEWFWGWLKKHFYGATSYAFIEGVIKRVRKLIWHYREGRLVSEI